MKEFFNLRKYIFRTFDKNNHKVLVRARRLFSTRFPLCHFKTCFICQGSISYNTMRKSISITHTERNVSQLYADLTTDCQLVFCRYSKGKIQIPKYSSDSYFEIKLQRVHLTTRNSYNVLCFGGQTINTHSVVCLLLPNFVCLLLTRMKQLSMGLGEIRFH